MGKKRKFTTEELQDSQVGAYLLKEHYTKKDLVGRNKHWWICQCVCGNIVHKQEYRIIHNKGARCSCNYIKKAKGEKSKLWRGVGDLSGSYLSTVRVHARQRKLEFAITIQQIWDIFIAQDKKCALTGVPLYFTTKNDDKVIVEHQTASLDRIDSKKGYTIDNVWWIHKDVNRVKNAYDIGDLVDMCYRIVEIFPKEIRTQKWIRSKTAKVN